mmetsp:Transcript_26664/g.61335  ORF Transcript_26664/g.61335 Transcript_26664/m.61335 type:complete len:90 (-) Transcript_26664:78-347(-)
MGRLTVNIRNGCKDIRSARLGSGASEEESEEFFRFFGYGIELFHYLFVPTKLTVLMYQFRPQSNLDYQNKNLSYDTVDMQDDSSIKSRL